MSKTFLTLCIAFPQKLESLPIKSLLWILSRNFRLRTDKHTLTKVLKCFILSQVWPIRTWLHVQTLDRSICVSGYF